MNSLSQPNLLLSLCLLFAFGCNSERSVTSTSPSLYEPTLESISQHPLPDWYDDAKLGIFVCWGPYSVPGWAKGTDIPLEEIFAKNLGEIWFKENPYAEWYLNSLKIDSSETQKHHFATYGIDFTYDDFIPIFNTESKKWDAEEMADIIKEVNAGYVVLVTKFHDGMVLWPTDHPNPFKPQYVSERDIVGELTKAVKERGMRMGMYYSSGLDWTYNDKTIKSFPDLYQAIPQQPEYAEYIDNHWRELIEKYDPSILWADIGSPESFDAIKLIADFYNHNPKGVVNNRHKLSLPGPTGALGEVIHHDFTTPEYQVLDSISSEKWETVRGIGLSFGYNQNEDEKEYLSVDELVDMFVDIVSKNGNLLLNVGPKADGTIPQKQLDVLKGFGTWLNINGESLFGTRPWMQASTQNVDGTRIRFTSKGDELYLIALDLPKDGLIKIENIEFPKINSITSLNDGKTVNFEANANKLEFSIPIYESEAYAFRIK